MSDNVRIFEVSLRDGLQNEASILSTDAKLAVVHDLVSAGFQDIEVTSFVRPRLVPQLADAADLVRQLPAAPGVRFWALVPNQVGLDRAVAAGVRHVATFMSASESHNRKNVNRTVRESLAGLSKVIDAAVSDGVQVRSYISTVFGCPFEGDISVEATLMIAKAMLDVGTDMVVLGDTTGMGQPDQVKRVLGHLTDNGIPLDRIGLHFHDTRGTALTNCYAAWQEGARNFDGAVGGVGGCPYAPGATGNLATEDLLHLLHRLGAQSGVDLDLTSQAGHHLADLLGRPLPGRYHGYWQAREARKVRSA